MRQTTVFLLNETPTEGKWWTTNKWNKEIKLWSIEVKRKAGYQKRNQKVYSGDFLLLFAATLGNRKSNSIMGQKRSGGYSGGEQVAEKLETIKFRLRQKQWVPLASHLYFHSFLHKWTGFADTDNLLIVSHAVNTVKETINISRSCDKALQSQQTGTTAITPDRCQRSCQRQRCCFVIV